MLLYHGTRHLDQILEAECLRRPTVGHRHISLTSSFAVALYWAMLERERPEQETPGIIIFTRKSLLKEGYLITLFDGTGDDDEAEYVILQDIDPVKEVVLGIVRPDPHPMELLTDYVTSM